MFEDDDIGLLIMHAFCATVGLILAGLGFIGLTGIHADTASTVTILLEPFGGDPAWDIRYFASLVFFGAWLATALFARTAAAIALGLVLLKVCIISGVIPLLSTMIVSTALCWVIRRRQFA